MKKIEIWNQKIAIEKQWLWMLSNLPEEELYLPRNTTRQDAINQALDNINYYIKLIKELEK